MPMRYAKEKVMTCKIPKFRLLLAAGIVAPALLATGASAMFPTLCSVDRHWSIVSDFRTLRPRAEKTLVYRVAFDVSGDGQSEVFLGLPGDDRQLDLHVYSPLADGDGFAYVGKVTAQELLASTKANQLLVLRTQPDEGSLVRQAFAVGDDGLQPAGETETAAPADLETARLWRIHNDAPVWQATLAEVMAYANDGSPFDWRDRDGGAEQANDATLFETITRFDRSGLKSAATKKCHFE